MPTSIQGTPLLLLARDNELKYEEICLRGVYLYSYIPKR
jgi:hypothetical protein